MQVVQGPGHGLPGPVEHMGEIIAVAISAWISAANMAPEDKSTAYADLQARWMAIPHLGDAGVGIGCRLPVTAGQLPTLALTVERAMSIGSSTASRMSSLT